ncbi:DUF6266 family protein [Pedobacter duraquae]|uniref:Uncharacterized protein n=1 Tax=Pedobacter duraquae TaxID=425511 RepID=A0A4R6INK8_9SPHI|nr:DUF6266 family protein [Pedobacter duraquae]TDO23747.1 hypothetical protein CLV32_0032 [Pedobacter duraquae]
MAKLTRGILGPLTGKLGNLVGQSWKKIHYVKPAPKKSTKPKTAGRLNNEAKFSFFSN